jgi:hypothetical protein
MTHVLKTQPAGRVLMTDAYCLSMTQPGMAGVVGAVVTVVVGAVVGVVVTGGVVVGVVAAGVGAAGWRPSPTAWWAWL